MKPVEYWWADTIKNPKDLPDFGCRTVGQATIKPCAPYRTSGAGQLADNDKISH
jgi:hypothetical protein